ncbi:MAG: 4-hydroxythreonine-4-phosphate dehydrogenase PdxA [Rhodospirillaceae bacterium]|nr:4-hydroxythreonine-4-phosphate dehydrogenase PdxA [Rhodospirillaceae bacterium]
MAPPPHSDAPPLALTMGEPAGVGGELSLRAWATARDQTGPFFAIDDPARLAALAERLGGGVTVEEIAAPAEAATVFAHALPVLAEPLAARAEPGKPNTANAGAVVNSIERATRLALDGTAAGLVTNPIQKSVLYAAGFEHPGHTEFVAKLCGDFEPVMMLACEALRAVPVTVHVSLRDAVDSLTTETIVTKGRITAAALKRDFGIARPRLAVAGLNPHGGEDGTLGTEDRDIVAPAVAILQSEGIDAFGPAPPDTLFSPRARRGYDAALCMLHDQALIPAKTLAFHDAVNVTLGLPIIRTSPDHGTALDIAGKGVARADSLVAAIEMAAGMAARRK